MTRSTVTVTTYRAAVTCDGCGLRLYAWQRAGLDRWLVGKGWVVGDEDWCPGCKQQEINSDQKERNATTVNSSR